MPARSTIRTLSGVLAAATLVAAVQPGGASAAGGGQKTKKADLSVTALSGVPTTVSRTAPLPLTATVRNRGKVKAKKGTVSFWWSADTRAGGDTLLARVGAPGLGPGRTAEVKAVATVPASVSGGGHVLACSTSAKDASSRNDCKASTPTTVPAVVTTPPTTPPTQPPVQQAPGSTFSGELRGDLHFVDAGSETRDADVWRFTADVSIGATVSGTTVQPTSAVVASTTSSYVLAGRSLTRTSSAPCPGSWEQVSQGSGRFPWTGDPYEDGLRTGIAKTDMSELSMVIEMPFTHTETWSSCDGSQSRTLPARHIIVLEFEQVARTARSVRYAVSDYHDVDSTTSEFETLTGQLELSLD
ncbi:hypothetical protein [Nocardioides flavescens]|uniref:CARDB protein n=1 Tax=Nocardioides flavescens TaxID=2691959 RepID=A0A6L7EWZ9_9ACTN|nr:hypothetical protein [Nocardioides flavescens]MXG88151.1 hypothetical protein [Nocardioides flavescens]